jgi:hypothetical protein
MDEVLPVFDLAPLVRLLAAGGPDDDDDASADLAAALERDAALRQLCAGVARCLVDASCVLVRDARVSPGANNAFLNAMEAYFARPDDEKRADCRPHLHYQVGRTPAGVETPRCVADPASCAAALSRQRPGHEARAPTRPDAKERFFWRVGPRPASTEFPELNAEQVVPRGCEAWWSRLLDGWGGALLAATEAVAVAAAHGLGLEGGPRCLADLMRGGPHLLAPTGSDLSPGGGAAEGDTLAGFHQDLNLLTIHGQARYPGLRVWLRDGRRLAVRVPAGCLLVQAGQQLERLTGGRVAAGWHEVVVPREALENARERTKGGRAGAGWRVSSTVFAHVASDATLRPLLSYARAGEEDEERKEDEEAWRRRHAPVKAGAQVQAELEAIKLAAVKQ